MRYTICLLLVPILLLSCRKGKKLSHVVYVHYEGPTNAGVSPQGAFSHFDPFDIYETDRYPDYVSVSEETDLASDFNKDLAELLQKNNIILTSNPADYTLKVSYLGVSESLCRDSYFDSCSLSSKYVYYSKLNANVNATLYQNGFSVDSWDRNANSSETVRDKTNSCNEPKIRGVLRGTGSLCSQLAHELRIKVANKLYDLEEN